MSVDRAVALILDADLITDPEKRRQGIRKIISDLERGAWRQGGHEASDANWWS